MDIAQITAHFAVPSPTERVTSFHAVDVTLPSGGTFVLMTMDNGEDHTKPTTLGPQGLLNAYRTLTECQQRAARGDIVGVGITGKPFLFAVGADLKDVSELRTATDARAIAALGHAALGLLGDMGVPTFAFVNGAMFGGGFEVALHCTYRTVMATMAGAALPETLLGLVPGWGGTYLLPRLVGTMKALQFIVQNPLSNNVLTNPRELVACGAADVMFDHVRFLEESLQWADAVLTGAVTVQRPDRSTSEGDVAGACAAARAWVATKTGLPEQVPAPYRAIDLIEAGPGRSREAGFAAEQDALTDLIMTDQFRAGVYALHLTQFRSKRPVGAPDFKSARPIGLVGIVGAGLMAAQLAVLFLRRLKVPVIMSDISQERVDRGVGYVQAELAKLAAKGRLTPEAHTRLAALVHGTTSTADFAHADLVIEAVFEELSVKQAVFSDLEKVVRDDCILATNTSSLSVTAMAEQLAHPERVIGLHFFNPVAVMPLLEVVRTASTDDASYATGFAVAKALRKTAIAVKDAPSFVVNRLLGRFMGEISRIVEEGTPIEAADQACRGITPMPPFELMALVGPAIALHNATSLNAAFGDRFFVSEHLKRVVGEGITSYYQAAEDGTRQLDPRVAALSVTPDDANHLDTDAVAHRVLSALADEVGRLLDEQVVAEPQDVDLAMITGAGFYFHNGGITPLLDRTGISQAVLGRRLLPAGVASVPN